MKCSIFRLQTDASRLSKEKKDYCAGLFLKKSGLRMPLSHLKTSMSLIYKTKTVKVKKQEAFEDCEIKVLSSQMRQSVREEVHGNIKALSVLKKHGKKVWRLKCLSRCNTVALKQAGTTYRIIENRLFVQRFNKPLRLGRVVKRRGR
ncbi:MAG: hypothetical protein LBP19_01585 [Treponema sp.]|jgi:hypothetical protein|nr:hypothetical protein [Treponema sp.]